MGEEKRNSRITAFPVIHTTLTDRVHRVRLYSDILDAVTWLKDLKSSASLKCVLRIGSEEQIVIEAAAMQDEPEPLEVLPENYETARYVASKWEVHMGASPIKRRREFTLPRELRLLKIAPKPKEETVIFAFGDRLEIWRGEPWRKYQAALEKERAEEATPRDDD